MVVFICIPKYIIFLYFRNHVGIFFFPICIQQQKAKMTSKHPPRGLTTTFNSSAFTWANQPVARGELDDVDTRLRVFEGGTFGDVGYQGSETSGLEAYVDLTKNQHTILKSAVLTEGVWYIMVNAKFRPTGGTIQKRKCEIVTDGQTTLQYGISFVEDTVLSNVNLFLPTSRIVSVPKGTSTTLNVIAYVQGGDSTANNADANWTLHRIS